MDRILSVKAMPDPALPVTTGNSYGQDLRNHLQAMNRELVSQSLEGSQKTIRRTTSNTPKTLPIVDIAQISAIGFHFNIHLLDNKVFFIIIYKINLLIEEKEALAIED